MVLEFGERPAARVVVARPTQPMAGELLLGVAGDGLEQRSLVAPLGHADLHPRPAPHRQPLLVGRRGRRARTARAPAWARRGSARRRTSTRGCGRSSRPGVSSSTLSRTNPLRPTHPALADVEDLHRGLELVLGDADHVEVLAAIGHHLLLLDRLAAPRRDGRGGGPPARTRGRSPPPACRRRGGRRSRRCHRRGTSHSSFTSCAVRHLLDLADARAGALLDVEQQARPAETLVLVELGRAAGADREATATGGRGCRGWRRRGRTGRSSGCPCACGRA